MQKGGDHDTVKRHASCAHGGFRAVDWARSPLALVARPVLFVLRG